MANEWKQYGAWTVIAAAAAVTGQFWFGRESRLPAAEDVAEIAAAVEERTRVPDLFGDERPGGGDAAEVGVRPAWVTGTGASGKGVGIYTLLEEARALARRPRHPDRERAWMWLDTRQAAPAHGAVAMAPGDWDGDTGGWTRDDVPVHPEDAGIRIPTVRWTLGRPASATSELASAGSLFPAGGFSVWPGEDGTNTPVCRAFLTAADVAERDRPTNLTDKAASPWWGWVGNGAVSWKYACELWPTNAHDRRVARVISAANADQAWNALERMTRTVAFIRYREETETRGYRWEQRGVSKSAPRYDEDITDWMREAAQERPGGSGGESAGGAMRDRMVSFSASGGGWGSYYRVGTDPATQSAGAEFSSSLRVAWWRGVELPYPSRWACASGYVARVTVYAALSSREWGRGGSTPSSRMQPEHALEGSVFEWDVRGNVPDPSSRAQDLAPAWAALPSAGDFPPFPGDLSVSGDGRQETIGWPLVMPARLSLVGEWEDPSEPPAFDLDGEPAWVVSAPEWVEEEWGERWTPSGGDSRETRGKASYVQYGQDVYLDYFVVVVDWKWRHCRVRSGQ